MKPRNRLETLLLFLAASALATACTITVHRGSSRGLDLQFGSWGSSRFDEKASEDREIPLSLGADGGAGEVAGVHLDVEGEVTVRTIPAATGPEGAGPRLLAHVATRGETEEDALECLRATRILSEVEGSMLTLRLERPDDRSAELDGGSSRFVLELPAGTEIGVHTTTGSVDVAGPFGATSVETGYGDIAVSGIAGDVNLQTSSGDVELTDVKGGGVNARSSYGDLVIGHVEARAFRAESSSGDVRLERVRGEMVVHSSYGRIKASGTEGPCKITASSGDVTVTGHVGRISADSSYGKVSVEGILAAVEARSSSGDVVVRAAPGSVIEDAWTLHSGYGDVAIFLPGSSAFRIAAKTGYGTIDTEFSTLIEAGRVSATQDFQGSVNGGGGLLKISSSSGDVAIRKSGDDRARSGESESPH